MKVIRGYKAELDLDDEQRTWVLSARGCERVSHTTGGLARSQQVYRATGKRPSAIGVAQRTQCPQANSVSLGCMRYRNAPRKRLCVILIQPISNFYRKSAAQKARQI